jgi:hypothetical protein
MGLSTQQLLDRIGTSEQNLNTRIGEIETAIQKQIETEAQTTREMVTETATETQRQVQEAAKQDAARDFFNLLMDADDLEGRRVDVGQVDPARINYVYDFKDIFATPQQAGMFVSPYGQAQKIQRPQQSQNSIMQGPLQIGGFAAGGEVDYDFLRELSQIMSFGEQ